MSNEQKMIYKQKEARSSIERKNWYRAFILSGALAVLIPICLLVIHFTKAYGIHNSGIKGFLVATEVFQLVSVVIGFLLISQEEIDKLKLYYKIYFLVNAILMVFMARPELAYSNSIFAYIILGGICFFTPVFVKKAGLAYSAFVAFWILITSAAAKGASREFVEILLFTGVCVVVSKYVSDKIYEFEKLSISLRYRTVTSESDPLTGLLNRRGLEHKSSVLWSYCSKKKNTKFGLIELDIDFFKKYNDKFGHPAGDKCLKQIADAIRIATHDVTEINARTGGEEFMIFVQDMDESAIIDLTLKIRKTIDEMEIVHAYAGISKYVTVSMGVAITSSKHGMNFDELYEEADKALYEAKLNGRNCIVYNNKIYGRMKNGLATAII